MLYIILILFVITGAFLLLNFRIRFQIGHGRRLLFVGLGRSGPQFDYAAGVGRIKLCGLNIRTFALGEKAEAVPKKKPPKPRDLAKKKKKPSRKRSLRDMAGVLPAVLKAVWLWFISLLKAAAIEELEGEIEAGFDSPDLTGTAFGYYQAAIAAVPGVASRVRFTPDWTGPSFAGSARGSVALPLYKIAGRTIQMIFRLPLRDLIKLAIGKKRGGQDGKQRS